MKVSNIAFIDGQNLHLGITSEGWEIDLKRFRVFLRDKFHIEEAYYFLGAVTNEETDLYYSLQKAGFILCFREHSSTMIGKKKGNVDTDIVFEIMKKIYLQEEFDKIVLVSGDGDYFKMVKFLIDEGRFERILFPNHKPSSLYKTFRNSTYYYLSNARSTLEYKKDKKKGGS